MSLYLGENLISGQTTLVGESRNIGQIIPSTIPLTDAGLHLLDGALIQGDGIYSAFVTYIAELVNKYPNLFVTESAWQTAVSSKGVCDKFVYDSTNNTVRLPKYGTQIITKTPSVASTVPVVGNGMTLGLTDKVSNFGMHTNNNTSYPYAIFGTGDYGKNIGVSGSGSYPTHQTTIGVTTDATKSGIIAVTSSLLTDYPLDCYYYIVIATSTKTDIEVDIDEVVTDLNRLDTMYQTMENIVENDTIKTNTITNCITEIPQDIKLELDNGTLTLKAGSKVYVPNGFESDGVTPKFDEVITTIDITYGTISTTAASRLLFVNVNDNTFADGSTTYCYSGDTATMNSTTAAAYSRFYNTETNKMYTGNGSSWVERSWALPIAIITNDSSGTITSIDQVFNGAGYIGNSLFVLPGLKTLVPNGLNNDGTYKNITGIINRVQIGSSTNTGVSFLGLYFDDYGNFTGFSWGAYKRTLQYLSDRPSSFTGGYTSYVSSENKNYINQGTSPSKLISIAFLTIDSSGISSLKLSKQFENVGERHLVQSYTSGTSWFNLYNDKWCEQGGEFNCPDGTQTTTNLLQSYKNTNYVVLLSKSDGFRYGNNGQSWTSLVSKATNSFVSQNNVVNHVSWYACGYIK